MIAIGKRRRLKIDNRMAPRVAIPRYTAKVNATVPVGMAVFESTGYTEGGKAFDRPGRATVVLGRQAVDEEWIAQHTHVSLFPGTPSRSFGTKREHPPAL
jgi:hypothetical protein